MKYGFIGFGNLAQAIHRGLKAQPGLEFAYHSKSNAHQQIQSFEKLADLVTFAEVIWLCVKPQIAEEVLDQLKNIDLNGKLIVSTLAGKKLDFFEARLNQPASLLRIMPNLAMAYGQSVTAYCSNAPFSDFLEPVKTHLKTLGKLVELPEDQFDLFAAVFGSGPAFLLQVMEAFRIQALKLALNQPQLDPLLAQLLLGTTTYFKDNIGKKNLPQMIDAVASQGGMTEEGLNYFRQNGLGQGIEAMIQAAQQRGRELAERGN